MRYLKGVFVYVWRGFTESREGVRREARGLIDALSCFPSAEDLALLEREARVRERKARWEKAMREVTR